MHPDLHAGVIKGNAAVDERDIRGGELGLGYNPDLQKSSSGFAKTKIWPLV